MMLMEKYSELSGLGLNFRDDVKARDVLEGLLVSSDFGILRKLFRGRIVFVFGCGPSLESDLRRVKKSCLLSGVVVVAVDGAVKALLKHGVVPNVCVSDLDGDLRSLKTACRIGCVLVVHGHGDNIGRLRSVVPNLSGKVLGTTQVKPTRKIKNFGGFTDGDRAVHLADHYKPKAVILLGMDFGNRIGKYSGRKNKKAKITKLNVGKKLLEQLAGTARVRILNATSAGEPIKGIPHLGLEQLMSVCKSK